MKEEEEEEEEEGRRRGGGGGGERGEGCAGANCASFSYLSLSCGFTGCCDEREWLSLRRFCSWFRELSCR